jgi:uncharacterized protein (DUF433 family)
MSTQIQLALSRSPDVCGGRLRIEGTRVTVNQIAWLYKQGEPPEEIAAHFPQLHLAQIYAALAHYHANRDEVEEALEIERREAERLRSEFQQPWAMQKGEE